MPQDARRFDAFISHRNVYKPWVETLAQNLTDCGFEVFLDEWNLKPGSYIAEQLHTALADSRNGILVATPDTLDSVWVSEEYHRMLDLQQNGFNILPIIFGQVPRHPFLSSRKCVDFSDSSEAGYRRAFHQLVAGLKGAEPGAEIDRQLAPVIPAPLDLVSREPATDALSSNEAEFLEDVLDALYSQRPVLILAQSGRETLGMHEAILRRARVRFGSDNCLHLVPPGNPGLDPDDYIGIVGRRLGLGEEITDADRLQDALCQRLERDGGFFLLITGMEDGPPAGLCALARTLRNVGHLYPGGFHLAFGGGMALTRLIFESGISSPLNDGEVHHWPEPTVGDLQDWQRERFPGPELKSNEAATLLALSGGHPQLIQTCLRRRRRQGALSDDDCQRLVERDGQISAWFSRHRDQTEELCRLLDENDLGQFDYWHRNETLRRLYWDNLLANRDNRLTWRSPLVRQIGKEALGCGD